MSIEEWAGRWDMGAPVRAAQAVTTLERSKAPDVREVEVFLRATQTDRITFAGRDLQAAARTRAIGAAVRVWRDDGRVGQSWTEDLSLDGLRTARDEAALLGTCGVPNQRSRQPAEPTIVENRFVGPTTEQLALKAKLDLVRETVERARAVPEVAALPAMWLEDTATAAAVVLDGSILSAQALTDTHLTVLLRARTPTDAPDASAYGMTRARRLVELDPTAAVAEALEQARALGDRAPLPAGCYDLVIQPSAIAYLLSTVGSLLAADAGRTGRGRAWGIGERVGSDRLCLVDDPLRLDGPASCSADAEGTPTRPRFLVEKGVVTALLHTRDSGPGGNAVRDDHRADVQAGITNLMLQPTNADVAELTRQAPDAIWVQAAHGFPPPGTPVSRDLRLILEGWRMRGGELCEPVRATLPGTVMSLLAGMDSATDDYRFFPSAGTGAGCTVLFRDQTLVAN